ncbi:MAG TPA: hypothetical protein VL595_04000 [Pseudonocardia sp.]|jgi:acetyl-CoA C-acetyltransferase|nr:hypothetical protein [Pseudonocardia sp.]
MTATEPRTTGVATPRATAGMGSRSGSVTLYDRLDRGRERSQPEGRFARISGKVETAKNLAERYGIAREAADEFAATSHRNAAAWAAGRFSHEIVPIVVPQRRGEPLVFDRDEGIRPDTTAEKFAPLRTLTTGGTVTAGNASQQNNAAAACLVVAEDRLEELGLEPVAYLVGWSAAGCDPATMGIGPVPAVAKLLGRLRLRLDDIDLVEINQALACQVLACWPNGGGTTGTGST